MNIVSYNRNAWNLQSNSRCRWCQPVDSETITRARNDDWSVILTPNKEVPLNWFGPLAGARTLCLASGGGQQAPTLAAAGANVVSFDNSDEQLSKDRMVADREGLRLETRRGDMADLSTFEDESFDLIFHPVSNVFSESVRPVWKECYRVLSKGGRLLAGFMNPAFFLFDHEEAEESGVLQVKYRLPYSDLSDLEHDKLEWIRKKEIPLEFGHTLQDQIGGQLDAGFVISGLYEDDWDDTATPLNKYASLYIATLARKF